MDKKGLSRRALFRKFVGKSESVASPSADATAESPAEEEAKPRSRLPLRRRPPGAIDEADFLIRCTACRDCVDACPYNAIHTLAEHVEPGARTPVMLPDMRPCHMCEGFPCIEACPEGALLPPPPEQPVPKLGSVTLVSTRCLPFLGPECGACSGLCPPEAPALRLVRGRPEIDDAVRVCRLRPVYRRLPYHAQSTGIGRAHP